MSPWLGCFSTAAAGSYSFSSPQHLAQRHMSASGHGSIHEGKGLENQNCRRWTNGAARTERQVLLMVLLTAQVNTLKPSHVLPYRTQSPQIRTRGAGLTSRVCCSPVRAVAGRAAGRPLGTYPASSWRASAVLDATWQGQQRGVGVPLPGRASSGGQPGPCPHPTWRGL